MTEPSLRLDKWLWYARFFKTRAQSTRACNGAKVRIAGEIVSKAHQKIRTGEVLTFSQGRHIRVVRVMALAERRGPAVEARLLYDDLKPPNRESGLPLEGARSWDAGRPTKRDRRAIDKLRGDR